MGLLLLLHVLLVAAVARAPAAQAWGKEGHYMTCKIAESFLTEEASTAVKDLLPGWAGGDLAETCSWADNQRFRYRWSSPLHFADSEGGCEFDYARDCHNTQGEKNMCVVGAINNYTAALKDSSSPFDPTESLMFLAHFVGDVHQPLHCGHPDDLGGNTIIVHWYRRKSNLHKVWDVNVIETAMKDFYNDDMSTMIEAIKINITEEWSKEEKQWETCRSRTKTCADKYADESAKLACKAYEGVEQDSTLEDDYFFSALPVVQKRIAQGGVRLAAILNKIFNGKSMLQSS
uniref:Aspergillus nuclease S1 n=1 Tax=Arundo donax TaxID=35708 RepID=A0A0A8XNE2_ARUDO